MNSQLPLFVEVRTNKFIVSTFKIVLHLVSVNRVVVSLDVTLHNLVHSSQFFGGKFCHRLQAEVGDSRFLCVPNYSPIHPESLESSWPSP
jgi:hypothetical protein